MENKKIETKYSYEEIEIEKISTDMYGIHYTDNISNYSTSCLLSKCKVRKSKLCSSTGKELKGKIAYRPVTNGYIRGLRIEASVIDSLFIQKT